MWRFNRILLHVIVLCIGITLGKLLNWGYFELDHRISIIEALTLFGTIGVALYISNILERRVQGDRIERELRTYEIAQIVDLLRSIESMFEEPSISYRRIRVRITTCNRRSSVMLEELGSMSVGSSRDRLRISELHGIIRDHSIRLKGLLTHTTIMSSVESGVTIEEGTVYYSLSQTMEINSEIDIISSALYKLKICINHL